MLIVRSLGGDVEDPHRLIAAADRHEEGAYTALRHVGHRQAVDGAVEGDFFLGHGKRAIRVALEVQDLSRAERNRDLAVIGRARNNGPVCRWLPVRQTRVCGIRIVVRERDALDVTDALGVDLDNAVFSKLLHAYPDIRGVLRERGFDKVEDFQGVSGGAERAAASGAVDGVDLGRVLECWVGHLHAHNGVQAGDGLDGRQVRQGARCEERRRKSGVRVYRELAALKERVVCLFSERLQLVQDPVARFARGVDETCPQDADAGHDWDGVEVLDLDLLHCALIRLDGKLEQIAVVGLEQVEEVAALERVQRARNNGSLAVRVLGGALAAWDGQPADGRLVVEDASVCDAVLAAHKDAAGRVGAARDAEQRVRGAVDGLGPLAHDASLVGSDSEAE
ncbi:hypothetical protein OPT61_g10464 [Boeremia exigua]|uniref:Uncharacterized protein n=1 Tax=Boeremia exigua TaxID=749465 RepID=A0ACC2HPY2_9PLEO|nr:hypothetical protein OPT61_g10464 [Boeremia exigua]